VYIKYSKRLTQARKVAKPIKAVVELCSTSKLKKFKLLKMTKIWITFEIAITIVQYEMTFVLCKKSDVVTESILFKRSSFSWYKAIWWSSSVFVYIFSLKPFIFLKFLEFWLGKKILDSPLKFAEKVASFLTEVSLIFPNLLLYYLFWSCNFFPKISIRFVYVVL